VLVLLMSMALANSSSASTPGPASAPVLSKVALVIGNAQYESVGALKNPVNDAQDICDALRSLGFTTSCYYNVKTRAKLRSLIQDFTESNPENSVSLVYYAGHAVQVNGENLLVPTAARLSTESAVQSESVSLSFVMRELQRSPHFLNIIILDACRNNPVAPGTQSLPSGLAQVQVTDLPDATEVLYATAANDLALDGEGRHGILTKNILASIRERGTVDDLFKQVSLGVQRDSQAMGKRQKPALYTNFTGRFCLVQCDEVESLQMEKQLSDDRVVDLQNSLAAGNQRAQAEIAVEKEKNAQLGEELKKKEQEAKAAGKTARAFDIPPAQ
jgi:uncharacterized caspase-like protein